MSAEHLDHPAVIAYREHFKLCPMAWFRKEIVQTVKDLSLWKDVLSNWGYEKDGKWKKFNPLNVKGLMSEYERRARNGESSNQRESIQERLPTRLSERRETPLPEVRQRERPGFRSRNKTLDEILAESLFNMRNPG